MARLDLSAFHATSQKLDFVGCMRNLFNEFLMGSIADRHRTREESAIQSHLGEHHRVWDLVFPSFPRCPGRRRTITREYRRGRRDAYLKSLVIAAVREYDAANQLIVNPVAVFGRHARSLANDLPACQLVATDIDPIWDRLYGFVSLWKYGGLKNYRFVRENIFEPDLQRRPTAVVFFGACGSLTDACMDYALAAGSPFLICRSCCHENIGGNTEIVRRSSLVNLFFVAKNRWFARLKTTHSGLYFSERYPQSAYPRSTAAREIIDPDTMIAIARNAPDSDICRSLIDLDRCLFLQEKGYDVMYREELFFAHQPSERSTTKPE